MTLHTLQCSGEGFSWDVIGTRSVLSMSRASVTEGNHQYHAQAEGCGEELPP